MPALAAVAARMSAREFLTWEPGDHQRYELVDGEPRAMAPAGTVHGLLQGELARLLGNHLRAHRPGCRVVANPGVIPRLLSAHNVRVPDLAVTGLPARPGQAVLPDPLLVIEILSPSNQADTWSNVWTYTSLPSVQEILVLQSVRVGAELLRRGPDGAWPERTEGTASGDLVLQSIGFRTPFTDLYADTGLAD